MLGRWDRTSITEKKEKRLLISFQEPRPNLLLFQYYFFFFNLMAEIPIGFVLGYRYSLYQC